MRPGSMKGEHLYLYPPKKWRRRLLMDYFLPGRRASGKYILIKGTDNVIASNPPFILRVAYLIYSKTLKTFV